MTETEDIIEKAIENEIPLSFEYLPSDPNADTSDLARRLVSPYSIDEGKADKELLTCWNHAGEHPQRFDIARIVNIRAEGGVEEFVRPVER